MPTGGAACAAKGPPTRALAARIAGDAVAQRIQLGIEYDPRPPFTAGSPETAPPEIVDFFRATSRFSR